MNTAWQTCRSCNERLRPYRNFAGGDVERGIRLYEHNLVLAESLYGILQGLEVVLRNSIHARLAQGLEMPAWYDLLFLQPEQAAMLKRAKQALDREGKPLDPGRVVAELAFGFWAGLTSAKYETIWRDHLVKIIARRPLQRVQLHDRLNSIRKLRNRVAHHEPILFSGRLPAYVNQIFDTISWMSPTTARWVRTNSSFDERFTAYRATFPTLGDGWRR
ncbi:MAG: Abi family protein [Acidobacteriota bacterium]|nr:Abi family protein [Acidobacteriota bacterium]